MDKKVILIGLLAIFGVVFVSGCIGESDNNEVDNGKNDIVKDVGINNNVKTDTDVKTNNNEKTNVDERNEEPEPPQYTSENNQ